MIEMRWTGLDDVLAMLKALPPRMRERAMKPGVDKAARYLSRAMKSALTRKRTGMLKASIGVRVKAPYAKATVYGIVGPRRSFVGDSSLGIRARWRRNRDRKKPEMAKITPTRYAHLIEKGHKGKVAPAYPFMAPAVQSSRSAVRQILSNEIRGKLSQLLQ